MAERGRPPKEKSFANMLGIELAQVLGLNSEGKPITKLRKIAEVLVSKAMEGDMAAINAVADRTDGKPMQAVEHTGEDGGPVVFTTIYEALRDKAEAEARDKLN
jgi:hypothetical protein